MCLNDSSILLMEWFAENDSYNPKNNYKQLSWSFLDDEKLNEEECQAAILLALSKMTESGFINRTERGNGKNKEELYIITRSIKKSQVSVDLSYQTAENISQVYNSIIPFFTLENVAPLQPRHLNEEHILSLIETISLLNNKLQETTKENEDLKANKTPPKDD